MAEYKVFTIVGARPQFVKIAPVSAALQNAESIHEIVVHTGQHYDENMSNIFFEELGISPPDFNLGVAGGRHGAMTARMLEEVERLLVRETPSLVLIYGDTNSTLAGALAASKMHIPVAHIEAGLRSFNKKMPEEVNRVLADHCSDLLFAPTENAVKNLLNEGVSKDSVHMVGDVMLDACLHFGRVSQKKSYRLREIGVEKGSFILATIHRQENTDDIERLNTIMEGLENLCSEMPVVMPLHPRTRGCLESLGFFKRSSLIKFLQPLGYLDMLMLESSSAVIVTDSGGVQKEAYFNRIPCVTLRQETEWEELVDTGWNRLVPPFEARSIVEQVKTALGSRGQDIDLYGDGYTSSKVAREIEAFLRQS